MWRSRRRSTARWISSSGASKVSAQKTAAPSGTAAFFLQVRKLKLVRDVVERRVQLVADALHGTDRRNGDKSCDQAVFNGSRALLVLNQLQKLAHGLGSSPFFSPRALSQSEVAKSLKSGA